MESHFESARPKPDQVLVDIADYVLDHRIDDTLAYETARNCLIDTLGCSLEALDYPACTKLLGPIVAGSVVPHGARVPGTNYQLDPIQAAFNTGTMIRWLDFNDTWLAAEWGHPSDNLGGILATADWISRNNVAARKDPLTVRDVLTAMIKAHEIQGCIALENSFNKVGLDHVVLVKVASTAVIAQMLGLTAEEITNAVSLAWVDGQSLRTYRHSPNTGWRNSWAAGDATSRAVRLALIARTGEMGYPSVLTAKTWGFYDVLFKGHAFKFQRPYGSYVMEHVLFKISFPAEFHSQTAVEAAMTIHGELARLGKSADDVKKITIRTHEACIRIIDKKGPLNNPADRDHCIQYMVAVPILFGRLTAGDYEDSVANDPRIDKLRDKIVCVEDKQFTKDYHDPDKRSIANAVTVEFNDGRKLKEIVVEYPIGHKRRRKEGMPILVEKFKTNLARQFAEKQRAAILDLCMDAKRLAGWSAKGSRTDEIPFILARIVLQDFTGVPLLADVAAMRSVAHRMGKNPKSIEPLVPVDLVVDHSVQIDHYGAANVLDLNMKLEFSRNRERYQFMKWGMQAFDTFKVVPPGIGIVHQVNLEYLAPGVFQKNGVYYPDTLVGTDSHTTMVNGIGGVGGGVGGIEAGAGIAREAGGFPPPPAGRGEPTSQPGGRRAPHQPLLTLPPN